MRIYLAARYSSRPQMLGVRDVLTALGHTVTSSWIEQTQFGPDGLAADDINADPTRATPVAATDLADLLRADAVIAFTTAGPSTTGARHVEHGIALGAGKRVILVGPRENIFHTLPQVEHYPDWPQLVIALTPNRLSAIDTAVDTAVDLTVAPALDAAAAEIAAALLEGAGQRQNPNRELSGREVRGADLDPLV